MAIANYEGYKSDDEEEEEVSDARIDLWEKIQKKTFTGWCNAHLRKVNESIEAIDQDFRSGLKLMRLLEVISGEQLSKPEKGKMRFHKIANVNKALEFIESKGVKLVSIGAEEIVDGNVKMTLGMIWTIILRFTIQDIQIEDSVAKEGLLLWCKRQTASYKNVNINNFHNSFKDGLAFCAIIHRFRPDLIDYETLNSKNAVFNLNTAFDAAEYHLDIPRMIDPEDIANSVKPDERSIMAYIAFYYHKFASENKASMAANRISNVIKMNQDVARLTNDYEKLSSDLLSWINLKLKYFSTRESPRTVSEVEKLQGELRGYQREEKPAKLHDKATLETTYSTIQVKLRLSKRPPYVPSAEKYISNVTARWNELESADKEYERWLIEELHRLWRLVYIIKKFEMRCSTHESWSTGKTQLLSGSNYRTDKLPQLQALMRKHEAFQSELTANQERVERICDLVKELQKLQYHDMDTVERRYAAVVSTTNEIKKLSDSREEEFARLLPVLEEIDMLHLDFAKRAAPFKNWMEQTEEDLRDTPIIHTMAEVKRYVSAHEVFEGTLGETQLEMNLITKCSDKVTRLANEHELTNMTENPYSNVQMHELVKLWEMVMDLSKKRSETLRMEEQRQTKNDKLREQFAQKATAFDQWLEKQKNAITSQTTANTDSLETQRDGLKRLEADILQQKTKLIELEQCSQDLEDAYVFDNPYTTLSMPALRVVWDQLFPSIQWSVNAIENQILLRDSRGLAAENMKDLRQCFEHFDHDKSGRLEKPEFKACLVSLGHSFGDDKSEAAKLDRVMQQVDPGRTGYVTFDAFLNFVTREDADDDTAEQIVQSFRALSGDKGYVVAEDIRRFLTPSDAEYCIERMKILNGPMGDSGALNYEQFAMEIYGTPKKA